MATNEKTAPRDLNRVWAAPITCRGERVVSGSAVAFTGCGVDLRDAILDIADAFDGELHTYACPACGAGHTWQGPGNPG